MQDHNNLESKLSNRYYLLDFEFNHIKINLV